MPTKRPFSKGRPDYLKTQKCPICGDKGEVYRMPGFQGNETATWTPCAAGPPWHQVKELADELETIKK